MEPAVCSRNNYANRSLRAWGKIGEAYGKNSSNIYPLEISKGSECSGTGCPMTSLTDIMLGAMK